jgi:uncharacterized SAM-binding protein YcdF (DUF218 family)
MTATRTGTRTALAATPTIFRGVLMRSRLEARWAGVLDQAGLAWEYEPQVIRLGRSHGRWQGGYVPDFWLPEQRTWLEVKGPHWERFEKTRALARQLGAGGQVLVATASGVCWRVPVQGRAPGTETWVGVCRCGTAALGVPVKGYLACRAAGCGRSDTKARWVFGW